MHRRRDQGRSKSCRCASSARRTLARLDLQSADIEGLDGLVKTLEDKLAGRLRLSPAFDRRVHLRVYEDLAVTRRIAQTARQVGDLSDHRILKTPLEADAADGGVAVSDSNPEAELMAVLLPLRVKSGHFVAHLHRHFHRTFRRVGTGKGIVQDDENEIGRASCREIE